MSVWVLFFNPLYRSLFLFLVSLALLLLVLLLLLRFFSLDNSYGCIILIRFDKRLVTHFHFIVISISEDIHTQPCHMQPKQNDLGRSFLYCAHFGCCFYSNAALNFFLSTIYVCAWMLLAMTAAAVATATQYCFVIQLSMLLAVRARHLCLSVEFALCVFFLLLLLPFVRIFEGILNEHKYVHSLNTNGQSMYMHTHGVYTRMTFVGVYWN